MSVIRYSIRQDREGYFDIVMHDRGAAFSIQTGIKTREQAEKARERWEVRERSAR